MTRYMPSDFPRLKQMYESWGMEIKEEDLPNIGFISDNAACFLLITNARVCFLEFLISKKGAEKSDELDNVMAACLNQAKELGYSSAYGLSSNDAAIARAEKNGFKFINQKSLLMRGI